MSKRHQPETNRATMSDASHTNPYTDTAFGETAVYSRGGTDGEAVTDGGHPDESGNVDGTTATVADVDHTPRRGAPDASEVYERGGESDTDE
ncbi:MAG: hypothetical protein ABEH90_10695 [Halolamina sp.]